MGGAGPCSKLFPPPSGVRTQRPAPSLCTAPLQVSIAPYNQCTIDPYEPIKARRSSSTASWGGCRARHGSHASDTDLSLPSAMQGPGPSCRRTLTRRSTASVHTLDSQYSAPACASQSSGSLATMEPLSPVKPARPGSRYRPLTP